MIDLDVNIIVYILAGLVVILLIWIIRLEVKIRNLLVGSTSKNLDDSIVYIKNELANFNRFKNSALSYFENIEKRMRKAIGSIKAVRFNPFKGTGSGGNQSFSAAFLNEEGEGLVLSSLYSRDRVSIFAKPLKEFSSQFELSDEEKQVVSEAKQTVSEHHTRS